MKIGILTFHCAHNYGAVLQCYATQEFLRSKGYDVEVINYRPRYLLDSYKLFNYKRISSRNPFLLFKKIIAEALNFRLRYRRWNGFEKFIHNYLILSEESSKTSIPSKYDIYIVGSDQIWNPNITDWDDTYFCKFPFDKRNKKYIAYAASMEVNALDNNIPYTDLLNCFDSLSVREENLRTLLTPFTALQIQHVLDPTLMVPLKVWESLSSNIVNTHKYVVVYQVRGNQHTIRIAEHIAEQIGAKVKILVAGIQRKSPEKKQDACPIEFVNTIRNAACVVTTSFHGTAFSIIFNRPFYTIRLNDGADSRSYSLLKSVSLEERLIDIDSLPTFSSIDYCKVNEKLDSLRQTSQEFILNNL